MNKVKKFLSIVTTISVVIWSFGPIIALPVQADAVDHFKITTGSASNTWERDIEFIYLDDDASTDVSIGDKRIMAPSGFADDSTVEAEDSDIGTTLYGLNNRKVTGADGNWSVNEGLYIDANNVLDSDNDGHLDWGENWTDREELVVGDHLETLTNAKVTTSVEDDLFYDIGEGVYVSTNSFALPGDTEIVTDYINGDNVSSVYLTDLTGLSVGNTIFVGSSTSTEAVIAAPLENNLVNFTTSVDFSANPVSIGGDVYYDGSPVNGKVTMPLVSLSDAKVSQGGDANVYNAGEGVFRSWDLEHTMDDMIIKSPTLQTANKIKVTKSDNMSISPGAMLELTISQVDSNGDVVTGTSSNNIYIDLEDSDTAIIQSIGGDFSVVQQYDSRHWLVNMSGVTGQGTVSVKDTTEGSFDIYAMSATTNFSEADSHKEITVMGAGTHGADHLEAVASSASVQYNSNVSVVLKQMDSVNNLIGSDLTDVTIQIINGDIVSINNSAVGFDGASDTSASNISLNNGEVTIVIKATGEVSDVISITPASNSLPGNNIATSVTIGSATVLTIMGYGPPNGESGAPLNAPVDFFFNADTGISSPVTNTTDSNFSIIDNTGAAVSGTWNQWTDTWGQNTLYGVTFSATAGTSLIASTTYIASVKKSFVAAKSIDAWMPALNETELVYSFSFTTNSGGGNFSFSEEDPSGGPNDSSMGGWEPGMDNQFTGDMGGAFPPMAFLDYPMPGTWDVPTNISSVIVGFDRPMDNTTFADNIYIKKLVNEEESDTLPVGTVVLTPNSDNTGVAITGYTFEANSQYRVIVKRDVKDSSGAELAGMPEGGGFGFGYGNMGPFKESFHTGAGAVTVNASYLGGNLDACNVSGSIINVPVGILIRLNFDNSLNPATINSTNVTLKKNNNINVSGTIDYDAMSNSIKFIPNSILLPNTSYTLAASTGVQSISGQAITAVSKTFTTGIADTTSPQIVWSDADNYGIFVQFDEPMNSITAENKGNYTLKTCNSSPGCDASAGTQVNLQSGVNFHYETMNNEVWMDGLTLNPGDDYYIEVANAVTDLSGNGVDAGSNSWSGVVMDASNFAGGQGMFNMDAMGFEDFNMSSMGMKPINVMPMNTMANATTVYFIDIPINNTIEANGTIELTFPSGFDVSQAKQDQYSPMNADFNGPGTGVVTFASTDPSGTGIIAGGVADDGIGVITSARKIIIKLSAATMSDDFLTFDLDGIKNSSEAKGFETSGYQVEIKTKSSSGALLEAMTAMPFFIGGAGTNTISGIISSGATKLNGVRVFLDSPMTGPMEVTTSQDGAGTLVAGDNDGEYKFENLLAGHYAVWTEPIFTVSNTDYYGQDWPEPIEVNGDEVKNFSVTESSADNGATVNVTITGTVTANSPANLGFSDSIDIFAGSQRGFVVKTLSRSELQAHISDSISNPITLYLPQAGDWHVGMGPAMPKGPMMGAMPEIDWMPSQPTNIMVTDSPWTASPSTLSFSFAGTDKTISGHVVDANGDAIANAEVFAHSPNSGGMGAHTTAKMDGAYTLNVVEGSYIVGAFLPGMPFGQETPVVVTSSGVYANNSTTVTTNVILEVSKPDYTISGRVTDGTNVVAGAAVWAHRTDGPGHADAHTDNSGNYTIYVSPGQWQLEAHSPGHGYLGGKTVTVSTASLTGQNFEPSSNLGSIAGTIDIPGTDDDSGTMVFAWGPAGGNEAKTSADGTYKINYLPYGTYTVDVFIPGIGDIASLSNIVVDGDETNKNFTVTQPQDITVTLSSAVEGDSFIDFFNTSNGMGNGVHIPAGDTSRKIQLPNGTYYINGFMPGVHFDKVTIVGDGYDDATKELTVNGAKAITITLPSLYTISGQVKVNGVGTNDAWVWVQNDSTKEYFGKVTANDGNSDGMYSMKAPNGTYKIGVNKPGYTSFPQEVVINSANQESINFSLTANNKSISGTITDDSNNPIANAHVWGEKIGGGWSGTETNASGVYSLSVSTGEWLIKAVAMDYMESDYSSADTTTNNVPNKNFQLTALTGDDRLKDPISKPLIPSTGGSVKDTDMGVNVIIPPQAMGSGSNSGQINVTETNSISSTVSAKPMSGKGKNITAKDSTGNAITQLNGNIEINMEYTVIELEANDVDTLTEQKKMNMAYWDDSTSNWVTMPTTVSYYDDTDIVLVDNVEADMSNITKINFKASVDHLTISTVIIPQDVDAPTPAGDTPSASGAGSALPKGPANLFFSINLGADTTNSQSVSLSMNANNATEVIISNSPDFADVTWEIYESDETVGMAVPGALLASSYYNLIEKQWTLLSGNGVKNVFVKFRDNRGNESSILSDMIVLQGQTATQGAGVSENDLVTTSDSSAVYLISDGQYHVFPHEAVYKSWAYASNFSGVKTISASILSGLSEGSPVPFRDGSMFRGVVESLYGHAAEAVFYVEDGKLRPIKSSEIYQELFDDPDWSLVTWVPDDLLSKFEYNLGDMIATTDTHPDGCLIKYADSTSIYLLENGLKRKFSSSSALIENGYDDVKIFTIPDTETYQSYDSIYSVAESLTVPFVAAMF